MVFTYFNFFGEDLHFIAYNDKGKRILTPLGLTLTILVIVWTFLITIAQRYAEHSQRKNADAKIKNELTICVNRSVGNICNNKYNTLISLIDDIEFGRARPKPIISRPCDQLKSITREIADAIISILSVNNKSSIDYNDLYVSILYRFKGEKWKQTYSHMPERGLSLSEVTTKKGTTFHQAFDSNNKNEENGYSFWVSKQEAKEKNCYIEDHNDRYDQDNKLKGSIFCYRIICQKSGIKHIEAMICVSTYSHMFLNNFDLSEDNYIKSKKREDNLEYNIGKYILLPFENRIMIELCLLCLAEKYEKHTKRTPEKNSRK